MFIGVLRSKSSRRVLNYSFSAYGGMINRPTRRVRPQGLTLPRCLAGFRWTRTLTKTISDTTTSGRQFMERNLTNLIRCSQGCLLRDLIPKYEIRQKENSMSLQQHTEKGPFKDDLAARFPNYVPMHPRKLQYIHRGVVGYLNFWMKQSNICLGTWKLLAKGSSVSSDWKSLWNWFLDGGGNTK